MALKRRAIDDSSESIHLAGWVYADLLLGLMVIFLATISFTPIDNFANQSLVKTSHKLVDKGLNYNKGLSLVYSTFDVKSIDNDIAKFIQNEKLGKNAQVIFTQILGGFDQKKETADDGLNRALVYSYRLQSSDNIYFSESAISVAGSAALRPNEFALRLTFVAKIN
jgi:hypothetical protein